jgi:MFS family permease
MAPFYRLVWNTACGFARSKNQLIAFRFLAGLGGSAPPAVGGAVIGDLFDAEHRGQAISIYSLAPLLGPVIGPVAGAWIAEKSTWRWVVCRCSPLGETQVFSDIDENSSGQHRSWMPLFKDLAFYF